MTGNSQFGVTWLNVEIGAGLIALWLASLVIMWFLIDRQTRPGLIRNLAVIEAMMLLSILSLLAGGTLIIKGLTGLG